MTTTNTAAATLTAADARRITGRIRDALAAADSLLVEAYRARIWEPLGHASWRDYVTAEIPALRMLRLTDDEARAKVQAMRETGMPIRPIADALGISTGLTHRYASEVDAPETVVSTDGRVRKGSGNPRRRITLDGPIVQQIVTLLTEHGPMTCQEVKRRTGWGHERASAALCRLAAAGRITYTAPAKRGQHGLYSASPA